MSQSGLINVPNNPVIAEIFVADIGSATPVANTIQILGGVGITTSAAGNTITITAINATTVLTGSSRLATNAEAIDGTINTNVVINPASLNAKLGTQTQFGVAIGEGPSNALAYTTAGPSNTVLLGNSGHNPFFGKVPNAALSNSSITVNSGIGLTGGGTVSLGGSTSLAVNVSLQITSGFESWGGVGNYFDDTVLGEFTILRPGTGYIDTVPVSWTAPQTITGLTAGNTYLIYIDSTGTIQKTTEPVSSIQNLIALFNCLRDSTSPTNNQITVKEDHPFNMPIAVYEYLDDIVGTVIENENNGANIVLNGTQKIQINGADVLSDNGVTTNIPDSGGIGVTFRKMFTNAGGKWATYNVTDTFTGHYNNAGTVTALGAGKFAVYILYVSKDTLNSTTPTYYAVLDTQQYNTQVQANTAIANETIAKASGELAALELAQLGFITYGQLANAITNVVISKSTLRGTTSTGSVGTAALVITDTSLFDGILSAADTNVQAALNTIDEWGKGATAHGVLIGEGVNTPIAAAIPTATSGIPLVSNGVASDPSFTTAVVAGGGTGNTTFTAYGVICAGTTATGAFQNVSGLGNSGEVLTSNGAGALPTWQAASGGSVSGIFGDGSDGMVTFDGSSVVLGLTPSSNIYTLTRDIFLDTSTINNGVTIKPNGYRFFCNGTLTNNGTISFNGKDGAANVAGATTNNSLSSINALVAGTTSLSLGGGNGGTTTGSNASNAGGTIATFGGSGGAGGTGTAGNTGGTAGNLNNSAFNGPPRWSHGFFSLSGGSSNIVYSGGTGGGGGGGDTTNAGGGGGAAGGVLIIYSYKFAGTGTISANGGNGGTRGATGNTGGGGGGGGGVVLVCSTSASGGAISGQTITATKGTGGAKSGTGISNGNDGNNGLVVILNP